MSAKHTFDVGETRGMAASDLPEFVSQQVTTAQRYYFTLKASAKADMKVALGGCERVAADYSIHRPEFAFCSIEFVAAGRGRVKIADHEYELMPGSVFGYGPGSPLEIMSNSAELMTKYYVTFCGRSAKRILKLAGLAPCGHAQIESLHQVRDIFEMMQTSGLAHTSFSQRICNSLTLTLAYKIAEQSNMHEDRSHWRAKATFLKIRDQIDKHYLELKNAEKIAAQCGHTVSYICQLFKKFSNVTPYQYLLNRRMQYAAELLNEPGALIKQVARRLEFADQFQFSRAFKRVFGISPTQFQQGYPAL
jgi:AraC-like DNA-binding protein